MIPSRPKPLVRKTPQKENSISLSIFKQNSFTDLCVTVETPVLHLVKTEDCSELDRLKHANALIDKIPGMREFLSGKTMECRNGDIINIADAIDQRRADLCFEQLEYYIEEHSGRKLIFTDGVYEIQLKLISITYHLEIKTYIELEDDLRQLRRYQRTLDEQPAHSTDLCVVCPKDFMKNQLEEQGFRFLKSPPPEQLPPIK